MLLCCFSEWIVVVEHHEKQGVDYKYILQVIERLHEVWGDTKQKAGNPEKELGQGKVSFSLTIGSRWTDKQTNR